ncbi:hypothetical protein SLOPH_721 [Spraguea lophii 42_110]|uniref:Uncharacterized protein n=1 Tax=Spraguea lophii (strain 42_110) TaxID=1358809 RepID=S7XW78_SPRLO|nr:hypothetical protein SLOPH_721 [Spraguea lophii 42_110]
MISIEDRKNTAKQMISLLKHIGLVGIYSEEETYRILIKLEHVVLSRVHRADEYFIFFNEIMQKISSLSNDNQKRFFVELLLRYGIYDKLLEENIEYRKDVRFVNPMQVLQLCKNKEIQYNRHGRGSESGMGNSDVFQIGNKINQSGGNKINQGGGNKSDVNYNDALNRIHYSYSPQQYRGSYNSPHMRSNTQKQIFNNSRSPGDSVNNMNNIPPSSKRVEAPKKTSFNTMPEKRKGVGEDFIGRWPGNVKNISEDKNIINQRQSQPIKYFDKQQPHNQILYNKNLGKEKSPYAQVQNSDKFCDLSYIGAPRHEISKNVQNPNINKIETKQIIPEKNNIDNNFQTIGIEEEMKYNKGIKDIFGFKNSFEIKKNFVKIKKNIDTEKFNEIHRNNNGGFNVLLNQRDAIYANKKQNILSQGKRTIQTEDKFVYSNKQTPVTPLNITKESYNNQTMKNKEFLNNASGDKRQTIAPIEEVIFGKQHIPYQETKKNYNKQNIIDDEHKKESVGFKPMEFNKNNFNMMDFKRKNLKKVINKTENQNKKEKEIFINSERIINRNIHDIIENRNKNRSPGEEPPDKIPKIIKSYSKNSSIIMKDGKIINVGREKEEKDLEIGIKNDLNTVIKILRDKNGGRIRFVIEKILNMEEEIILSEGEQNEISKRLKEIMDDLINNQNLFIYHSEITDNENFRKYLHFKKFIKEITATIDFEGIFIVNLENVEEISKIIGELKESCIKDLNRYGKTLKDAKFDYNKWINEAIKAMEKKRKYKTQFK